MIKFSFLCDVLDFYWYTNNGWAVVAASLTETKVKRNDHVKDF